MTKRILFIGDMNPYSRSYHMYDALREVDGYHVDGLSTVPLGRIPGKTHTPSLVERVRYKLGLPADETHVNAHMLDDLERNGPPDILWLMKATTVHRKTIQRFKQTPGGPFVVFISYDNLTVRANRTRNIERFMPLVDLCLTKWSTIDGMAKLGPAQVAEFKFGFNPNFITPRPQTAQYEHDVTFVGTFEQQRYESLKFLAQNGIKVIIFGNSWEHLSPSPHPNLLIQYRPVFEDDWLHVIHHSKIVLNFLRKFSSDHVTDRTLEIPGAGAFMIAERSIPHETLFHDGREAVFFSDDRELLEKVRYYLAHENERKNIERAGYQRCITDGYTYQQRFTEVLRMIEQNTNTVNQAKSEPRNR